MKNLSYLMLITIVGISSFSCEKDDEEPTQEVKNINSTDGNKYGEIIDSRDNNTYMTVRIGTQVWFAENLRYIGGNLVEIKEKSEWIDIRGDSSVYAWSYYDNQPANKERYRVLYHHHAVIGESLCPPGWRIPTKNDWSLLFKFLGGVDYVEHSLLTITPIVGGKLKSTTYWNSPNLGATDEVGFSALGGGGRSNLGNFLNEGNTVSFWSSTLDGVLANHREFPNGKETLYYYLLHHDDDEVERWNHQYAQSSAKHCRCIKD